MDDLQVLKLELIEEVKNLVSSAISPQKNLLKSKDVRKMLGISHGTLQSLRNNGVLSYSKMGGTVYYEYADVMKALQKNKVGATPGKEIGHGK